MKRVFKRGSIKSYAVHFMIEHAKKKETRNLYQAHKNQSTAFNYDSINPRAS